MLSNDSSTSKTTAAPSRAGAPSIIGNNLRFVGSLNSVGEVHIDGIVDGDVNVKVLLIGETAHAKGEVNCESVRIHGKVTGRVSAKTVYLAKSAHVTGDILHESLTIETGAFIEGHCKQLGSDGISQINNRINLISPDT
jgi:cytoskeletal protein CcmA (bactofilin family)